jgi:hypothetical protein
MVAFQMIPDGRKESRGPDDVSITDKNDPPIFRIAGRKNNEPEGGDA